MRWYVERRRWVFRIINNTIRILILLRTLIYNILCFIRRDCIEWSSFPQHFLLTSIWCFPPPFFREFSFWAMSPHVWYRLKYCHYYMNTHNEQTQHKELTTAYSWWTLVYTIIPTFQSWLLIMVTLLIVFLFLNVI